MAEWRSLPGDEQAVLREGLRAEFGKQEWEDAAEAALPELIGQDFAAGPPQQVRDSSLASLAEMGFTVREVS